MATNLQIDDVLLRKAQKVGGFKTKKETVNQSLAEFVARHEQLNVLSLFGAVEVAPDFNYKRLRKKR
jgi:Arc/MetJ family transcription regulator